MVDKVVDSVGVQVHSPVPRIRYVVMAAPKELCSRLFCVRVAVVLYWREVQLFQRFQVVFKEFREGRPTCAQSRTPTLIVSCKVRCDGRLLISRYLEESDQQRPISYTKVLNHALHSIRSAERRWLRATHRVPSQVTKRK